MDSAKESATFQFLPMAKSSPEKLAAALRANLKRRKEGPSKAQAAKPSPPPSESAPKPPKNSA